MRPPCLKARQFPPSQAKSVGSGLNVGLSWLHTSSLQTSQSSFESPGSHLLNTLRLRLVYYSVRLQFNIWCGFHISSICLFSSFFLFWFTRLAFPFLDRYNYIVMALAIASFPKLCSVPLLIFPEYTTHHWFSRIISLFVYTSQFTSLKGLRFSWFQLTVHLRTSTQFSSAAEVGLPWFSFLSALFLNLDCSWSCKLLGQTIYHFCSSDTSHVIHIF